MMPHMDDRPPAPSAPSLPGWLAPTIGALRHVMAVAVIGLFVIMTVSVLAQVGGRYVFNYSIAWAVETATYAQIWVVLLAGGIAMRHGLHMSVDLVLSALPRRARQLLAIAIGLACIAFLGVIFTGSFRLLAIGEIQTSPVLGLSMWWIYLAIPIGSVYFAIESIIVTVRLILGQPPHEAYPELDQAS